MTTPLSPSPRAARRRKASPRAIAEAAATVLIIAGVVMLMQPFSLTLYGWSFAVTLAGTALFLVGTKLPR